jgi:hypothetical protein
MRVASRLMVLGAVVLGMVLPSVASAGVSPVLVNLYLSGKQTIRTATGFTSTSDVSFGTNASHGPNVGRARFSCRPEAGSTALCTASIEVNDTGTTRAIGSVVNFGQVVDLRAPNFHIDFDTGIWGGTNGGFFTMQRVSESASNVQLELIF